jgi:hypothetical protein
MGGPAFGISLMPQQFGAKNTSNFASRVHGAYHAALTGNPWRGKPNPPPRGRAYRAEDISLEDAYLSLSEVSMSRFFWRRYSAATISVVIVRVCGRSSNHERWGLARLCNEPARVDYWMPRLKAGHDSPEIRGET